jgi:hypothetical protein
MWPLSDWRGSLLRSRIGAASDDCGEPPQGWMSEWVMAAGRAGAMAGWGGTARAMAGREIGDLSNEGTTEALPGSVPT